MTLQKYKRIIKILLGGGWEQSQDGGGMGWETTFSSTNISENHLHTEQLTKQFLNTGRKTPVTQKG